MCWARAGSCAQKVFGVILLAIAVKLFSTNLPLLLDWPGSAPWISYLWRLILTDIP